jgi:hypothetical protein
MEKDPFIEALATFRGITYEEAEKQHLFDMSVDYAEFAMVKGLPAPELAKDQAGLFQAVAACKTYIQVVREVQKSLIGKGMDRLRALTKAVGEPTEGGEVDVGSSSTQEVQQVAVALVETTEAHRQD